MSDSPPEPDLAQRLGLVLRGVQRMADGVGALEQGLPELATAERLQALSDRVDEYRVRSRAELRQVNDLLTALATAVEAVLRDQESLGQRLRSLSTEALAGAAGPDVERLAAAVRALRDDLAESHRQLAEQTQAAVERVAGEQAERALRLSTAISEVAERTAAAVAAIQVPGAEADAGIRDELAQLRQTLDGRHVVVTEAIAALHEQLRAFPPPPPPAEPPPAPAPPYDDTALRQAVAALKDDVARVQGEVVAAAGQVRTDLASRLPGGDVEALQGIHDRLGGIEWRMGERLDPLVDRVAALEARLADVQPDRTLADRLAALEAGLEQLAQREDLRRGVERVVGAVASAEQAVTHEVKAIDARVGTIAEEVRTVRMLRDGLQALAENVDGVRQLASRGATSQQMAEITRELGAVLAEIESARHQVLQVERSATPVAADVIAVGAEVDDLGRRIDQLAQVIEEKVTVRSAGDMAERLRHAGEAARQLGNGVLDDLRSRRSRRR